MRVQEAHDLFGDVEGLLDMYTNTAAVAGGEGWDQLNRTNGHEDLGQLHGI